MSVSKAVTSSFALGMTGRLRYGSQEVPSGLSLVTTYGRAPGSDEETILQQEGVADSTTHGSGTADIDVSFTYDPTAQIRIGGAVPNAFDRPVETNANEHDGRTYGIGASVSLEPFQIGADVEWSSHTGWNSSVGATLMAGKDFEFGMGFVTVDHTVRWSLRFRALLLSYSLSRAGHSATLGTRVRF